MDLKLCLVLFILIVLFKLCLLYFCNPIIHRPYILNHNKIEYVSLMFNHEWLVRWWPKVLKYDRSNIIVLLKHVKVICFNFKLCPNKRIWAWVYVVAIQNDWWWHRFCLYIEFDMSTLLEYFCKNHGDQRFLQFEIIINVLVSSFRFIWIPVMGIRPVEIF